ncbi:MAG: TolC family protein [Gammaproteobacteria bacterium]
MKRAIAFVVCCWLGGYAKADAALSLEDVLASSLRHFPRVLAATEKIRAQQGKVLASEGAFDLQLENDTYARAAGFYDGRIIDSKIVKPLPSMNTRLYGGYRIADGEFPVYEDEYFTNGGGEFKVGAVFSLLRDRDIDDRRFTLRDSRLALTQRELEARLTQIEVQHQATRVYLAWLAAGQARATYAALLQLAEARQGALEERVAHGDLARVYLNENQQYILKRAGRVTEAARVLANHANRLALYLRDDQGRPVVPEPTRQPTAWPDLGEVDAADLEASIAATLAGRPELGINAADIARERNRLALGRNALKTRVDLNLEASRDLGRGSVTREETDAIVRFDITVPLERRTGRGQVAEAQANLSRLELERQLLNEQIAVEVRNIANDIAAAERFLELAGREVEQAEILEAAERERFDDGASDFFVVNLREEAAADARVRRIEARLGYLQALTDFYAATVRLDRFQIPAD